jgi:hypothetical protein
VISPTAQTMITIKKITNIIKKRFAHRHGDPHLCATKCNPLPANGDLRRPIQTLDLS